MVIRILTNLHNSILDLLQSIPRLHSKMQISLHHSPVENSFLALKYFLNKIQTFRLIFNYLLLPNSLALSFITPPLLPHYPILWWWETAFSFSNELCSHIFWTNPHSLLISTPTPFTETLTQPLRLSSDVNLLWKDILHILSINQIPCCVLSYNPGYSSTIEISFSQNCLLSSTWLLSGVKTVSSALSKEPTYS